MLYFMYMTEHWFSLVSEVKFGQNKIPVEPLRKFLQFKRFIFIGIKYRTIRCRSSNGDP